MLQGFCFVRTLVFRHNGRAFKELRQRFNLMSAAFYKILLPAAWREQRLG
jgi:hypothetical protein